MAKVLVVEDDTLLLHMFEKMIVLHGHEVVLANDGQEGVEKAHKEKPSMIFLDIMMPKMNGIQVLKALKSDPETKDIPVVVLTNLTKVNDAAEVIARGALKYIDKSQFDMRQVGLLIQQVMGATTKNSPATKSGV
jgi:CheY-like chemotaxis protein